MELTQTSEESLLQANALMHHQGLKVCWQTCHMEN